MAPWRSLLHKLFHYWIFDLAVSFVNWMVLLYVYEPMMGEPLAHQVGMSTRIFYIFIIAYFMLRSMKQFSQRDLLQLGLLWTGLWLVFEWGGSLIAGRTVDEILIGWNIFNGYMWPYVLLSYLTSSLIIGMIIYKPKPSGELP